MEKKDEEDSEYDQFDYLVPKNWKEIAEMRLRKLEEEYDKCL